MEFGEVPLDDAEGTILAHSQATQRGWLRKGASLGVTEIAALREAGFERIAVARLGPEDMDEDAAAAVLGAALVADPKAAGLRVTEARTGRVNVYATFPGILCLDAARIEALNRRDPMITIATLPDKARCSAGTMVATVKIISYAVARASVQAGSAALSSAMRMAPVVLRDATLIMTEQGRGPGKGEVAVATRLDRLGMRLAGTLAVPHDADAIAGALERAEGELVLILTASATSDVRDVGPEGVRRAGGAVDRFGMPVDPGNLLFLGRHRGRAVIGLPGCARSPSLNGADWVLERVACGMPPGDAEFAVMGVGGLLKESPARPHPRRG